MAASISQHAVLFARRKTRILLRPLFHSCAANTLKGSNGIFVPGSCKYKSLLVRGECVSPRYGPTSTTRSLTVGSRSTQALCQRHGSVSNSVGKHAETETETPAFQRGNEEIPKSLHNARQRIGRLHGLAEKGHSSSPTHDYAHIINDEKQSYKSRKHHIMRTKYEESLSNSNEIDQISSHPSIPMEDDFFGIQEVVGGSNINNSKIMDNTVRSTDKAFDRSKLSKKFKHILTLKPKNDVVVEQVIDLPYGVMRRDSDNQLKRRRTGRSGAADEQRPPVAENTKLLHAKGFPLGGISEESTIRYPIHKEQVNAVETEFNCFDDEYFGPMIPKPSAGAARSNEPLDGANVTEMNKYSPRKNFPSSDPNKHDESLSSKLDDSTSSFNEISSNIEDCERKIISTSTSSDISKAHEHVSAQNSHLNYFDEAYFPSFTTQGSHSRLDQAEEANTSTKTPHVSPNKHVSALPSADCLNEFDKQYFDIGHCDNENRPPANKEKKLNGSTEESVPLGVKGADTDIMKEKHSPLSKAFDENTISGALPFENNALLNNAHDVEYDHGENVDFSIPDTNSQISNDMTNPPDENVYVGGIVKQQKRLTHKPNTDNENSKSAYGYAMEFRRSSRNQEWVNTSKVSVPWDGAVDEKGFRKLKSQVRDVQNIPEDLVVKMLHESVLYENKDFIALDKPYGLPSHGGPGIHHSIGKLAPLIADKMKAPRLELVHRLDKETTGVMLLAKSEEALYKLRSYFKERRVIKRYWVITKGIPSPLEGVIDIPMVESQVGDGERYRMKLLPYKSEETSLVLRKQQLDIPRKEAVTKFKVLDSKNQSALIECEPESGVKHQIRCHLAFALNTPILGDHKYSHFSKIAPQKLPSEMLQRLHIRQPTVRYVAMHLHAKELVLPQFYDGKNVFISARLPRHFVQNMKWLKLKPPHGR